MEADFHAVGAGIATGVKVAALAKLKLDLHGKGALTYENNVVNAIQQLASLDFVEKFLANNFSEEQYDQLVGKLMDYLEELNDDLIGAFLHDVERAGSTYP